MPINKTTAHLQLARLGKLKLAAKLLAEGYASGIHTGKHQGEGMEFSNYRSYEPGDDLRLLDWKLMARTDRMYVKQAESERNLNVRFLLDASASMRYGEGGLAKFDYARLLTAALGYVAHWQGDAVGLHLIGGEEGGKSLPPQQSARQLERFFHMLENAAPSGIWNAGRKTAYLAPKGSKRELVVLASDFYEKGSEISELALRLASQKHEVLAFHLLGRAETAFKLGGLVEFVDLETGESVERLADKDFAAAYQHNLKAWMDGLGKQFRPKKIAYHKLDITEPIDAGLHNFFQKRVTSGG